MRVLFAISLLTVTPAFAACPDHPPADLLAFATAKEQCSWMEYLVPEQFEPGELCHGVANPFLAEARNVQRQLAEWQANNPGCPMASGRR